MQKFLQNSEIVEAVNWRHHLHRNPELGFEEIETSAFIAARLAEWGYAVKTGYGKTGLIGSLSRGSSSKAIGIRADIDALPILEKSGADYVSRTAGKMHACGHDGHVAMALAAAKSLSSQTFDGTVHFVFQPAEENEGGGRAMVGDGLFRDFAMDGIYGMHNWPALELGQCVARDSEMMAAFGTFEIKVKGRGAHGAMPHEGADPIVAASQIVSALQTIASRNVSPLQSAVVSATQVHGGDAWNVIPEEVVIRGTTRWFDEHVGVKIETRLTALANAISSAFDCVADVDYMHRYPATINDPAFAAIIRNVAPNVAGVTVTDADPSMAAEDFSFMLREKRGCYFWLGAKKRGNNPGLHSPYFDFNDALLPLGANMWISLVQDQLKAA
ncbi:M20 aminoacylase family protein [Agrobacterium sp. rho-13.3]|uniref:M20 aminoacylase family protein n=1 Tax=Agrobacterium sp. rho-13.3 TaxID=3072980 RepID=UPI002A14241D|nr:M20 aminoacylase family protein [Agrobacterium sp. rho-13.3]MDX8309370.1 M20 aminoacylase family protein [Agrobacterium sp. rho-13.3]